MSQRLKTACILCSRNCGLSVEVEHGHFTRIRGDDQHPMTQGYICQKAARLDHYQHHADRLAYPLKRQENGHFVRVTWEEAINDIAQRLVELRERFGDGAFATAGGGGQGNHLGGAYLAQLRSAMRSPFAYNSLAQEKTGDFWVNGRLFGSQNCHTTEDVEHSDYVIFLGCNPFQAHGIPNARKTLRALKNDIGRTMVVIDPRRTETAREADIHLQLRPGTDAYLLSAMLAIMVRENLHDSAFLARHCEGFADIEASLQRVSVADYAAHCDVPLADIERVARGYGQAAAGCLRVDLGIQHTLNSTLNSYLEKLMFLVAGHFGKPGGNNLHSALIPLIGDTDERKPRYQRTAYHRMFSIAGIMPPAILPDEILKAGEQRIRSVFVDSCNPVLTWPDTGAYEQSFSALDLLVVVDVAMTETARLADYVLPAASQFEKWEFTGFNLEFPRNAFQLRQPVFAATGESLPEAEIYTRILEAMGELPPSFPLLSAIARSSARAHRSVFVRSDSGASGYLAYTGALAAKLAANRHLARYAPSLMYRTLGPSLAEGAGSAAFLLPLCLDFARKYPDAVRRAGHRGNRFTLGVNLFNAILSARSGVVFSEHCFDEMWSLLKTDSGKVQLAIPEMLDAWNGLIAPRELDARYPFVLAAGERRSYNANQIFRDPEWRKVDKAGALRMHPADAERLGIAEGDSVWCESAQARLAVTAMLDEGLRVGMVTLPHGYGQRYAGSAPLGPQINRLTSAEHCDPLARTPLHKYVPVAIGKMTDVADVGVEIMNVAGVNGSWR